MGYEMKIAICEDDDLMLKIIKNNTDNFFSENKISGIIETFKSAEAFLFNYDENPDYDILLLDIQMKGISGIELAHKLRLLGDKCQIIFITSITDYVYDGYSVQAADYLLKPVDKNKLYIALNRCIDNMNLKEKELIFDLNGNKTKIKEKDIYYIESEGRKTHIHLALEDFFTNKSISSFDNFLDITTFFKCHRSFIVNLIHISSIHKSNIILDNNMTVPISRDKYKQLNEKFINYYKRNNDESFV